MARRARRIPPSWIGWNVALWAAVWLTILGAIVHRAEAQKSQVTQSQKAR